MGRVEALPNRPIVISVHLTIRPARSLHDALPPGHGRAPRADAPIPDTLIYSLFNKEHIMKSSKWITPIALATLASLTLAMNAHARGGGMGGGGMGGGQGYKQMGGQNQGQQQGETSRMRKRDPSQHEGQQETRAMNQERVRKQDGSGAMERRHDNPQSAASE